MLTKVYFQLVCNNYISVFCYLRIHLKHLFNPVMVKCYMAFTEDKLLSLLDFVFHLLEVKCLSSSVNF